MNKPYKRSSIYQHNFTTTSPQHTVRGAYALTFRNTGPNDSVIVTGDGNRISVLAGGDDVEFIASPEALFYESFVLQDKKTVQEVVLLYSYINAE
jgi:hypothetical protein